MGLITKAKSLINKLEAEGRNDLAEEVLVLTVMLIKRGTIIKELKENRRQFWLDKHAMCVHND